MKVKITNWLTGETILEVEAGSVKEALEAHVSADRGLDRASLDGASLDGASLDGARLDGASLDGASLDGASLDGASLDGASLDRASLDRASLDRAIVDGGQERRGFRFWAWRNPNGAIIYRGGCHEWQTFAEAIEHYGASYGGGGNREECLTRLALMRDEAARRWGKL